MNAELHGIRSDCGKLGALKRWAGHVKIVKPKRNRYEIFSDRRSIGIKCRVNGVRSKEYHKAYMRLWREENRELNALHNHTYKTRKKGAQGTHTLNDWLELKAHYNFMCLCCKQFEPNIKLTEDHIIPLSMGGTDTISNIQPLCGYCNNKKYVKTTDFRPLNIVSNFKEERRVIK